MAFSKHNLYQQAWIEETYVDHYQRNHGKIDVKAILDGPTVATFELASWPTALQWLDDCHKNGEALAESVRNLFRWAIMELDRIIEPMTALSFVSQAAAIAWSHRKSERGLDPTVLKCEVHNPNHILMEQDWAQFQGLPFKRLLKEDRHHHLLFGMMNYVCARLEYHFSNCDIAGHAAKVEVIPSGTANLPAKDSFDQMLAQLKQGKR